MSDALQQDQSTPINSIQGERVQMTPQQNNGELVDNVQNTYQQMNSDEEGDISDDMYSRQMMGDVNEPVQQYDGPSHNVPKPPSMMSSLTNNLKGPLIVLVVYFVLSINITQHIIYMYKIKNINNVLFITGVSVISLLIILLIVLHKKTNTIFQSIVVWLILFIISNWCVKSLPLAIFSSIILVLLLSFIRCNRNVRENFDDDKDKDAYTKLDDDDSTKDDNTKDDDSTKG